MKLSLTFRSNDKILLQSFFENLKLTFFQLYDEKLPHIGLPTKSNKYTILRSPHIDKKSRDQWEKRVYSIYCIIKNEQKLLDYILKHTPAGIGVVVHRKQRLYF